MNFRVCFVLLFLVSYAYHAAATSVAPETVEDEPRTRCSHSSDLDADPEDPSNLVRVKRNYIFRPRPGNSVDESSFVSPQSADAVSALAQTRSSVFSPIRIVYDWTHFNQAGFDADVVDEMLYLMEQAQIWWSSVLSVIPLSAPIVLSSDSNCNWDTQPDSSFFSSGISNADLVIFMQGPTAQTQSLFNPGTYALAGACIYEDAMSLMKGRPVVGYISVNLNSDLFYETVDVQLAFLKHEMSHVLGFSDSVMSSYLDPTTLQPYSYPITASWTTSAGKTVTVLKTPKVLAAVRTFFNCSTLQGAELEDQGTNVAGSHWELRLFYTEYMAPTIPKLPVFSTITFALFEDMGWYKVNYGMASRNLFGEYAGCTFADPETRCLSKSSTPTTNYAPYYGVPAALPTLNSSKFLWGCASDRQYMGFAKTSLWTSSGNTMVQSYNQYWTGNPSVGGDLYADFCPIFMGTPSLDCTNHDNAWASAGYWGLGWGTGAKCIDFTSTFIKSGYTSSGQPRGGCFITACDYTMSPPVLKITVNTTMPGSTPATPTSTLVTCPTAGGSVTVSGFSGTITCPPAAKMCPTAGNTITDCTNQCSGRGTCVNGACQCNYGFIPPDCANTPTGTPSPTPSPSASDTPTNTPSASGTPTSSAPPTRTLVPGAPTSKPATPSAVLTSSPLPSTVPTVSAVQTPTSAPTPLMPVRLMVRLDADYDSYTLTTTEAAVRQQICSTYGITNDQITGLVFLRGSVVVVATIVPAASQTSSSLQAQISSVPSAAVSSGLGGYTVFDSSTTVLNTTQSGSLYGLPSGPNPNPGPTSTGLVAGDPHVRTLDGLLVSYLGCGDNTMLKLLDSDFLLQSRHCLIESMGSSTCAIALRCDGVPPYRKGEVIEFYANEHDVEILIDGYPWPVEERYMSHTLLIHQKEHGHDDHVDMHLHVQCRMSGVGLDVWLRESKELMYFDMTAKVPDTLMGRTSGLLGPMDGDVENDIQFPDGTTWNPGHGLDHVSALDFPDLDDVQDAWTVAEGESLFTKGKASVCSSGSRRKLLSAVDDNKWHTARTLCSRAGLTGQHLDMCAFDYIATGGDESLIRNSVELAESQHVGPITVRRRRRALSVPDGGQNNPHNHFAA